MWDRKEIKETLKRKESSKRLELDNDSLQRNYCPCCPRRTLSHVKRVVLKKRRMKLTLQEFKDVYNCASSLSNDEKALNPIKS